MNAVELQMIRSTVEQASNAAGDYDGQVIITSESDDFVSIEYQDEDCASYNARVKPMGQIVDEETHYLLGVHLDDQHGWRVIDSRGSSLFAILHAG